MNAINSFREILPCFAGDQILVETNTLIMCLSRTTSSDKSTWLLIIEQPNQNDNSNSSKFALWPTLRSAVDRLPCTLKSASPGSFRAKKMLES